MPKIKSHPTDTDRWIELHSVCAEFYQMAWSREIEDWNRQLAYHASEVDRLKQLKQSQQTG
jgi:hypothetical protein